MADPDLVSMGTKVGGGGGAAAIVVTIGDWIRKRGTMKKIHDQIEALQTKTENQNVMLARLEERQVTKTDLVNLGTQINNSILTANAPLITRIDDLYRMAGNDRRQV